MCKKILPLLLLFFVALTSKAQNSQPPSLNIADPAPQLAVTDWLKGEPFRQFEKGKVYVVEFWATWCHPCILSMPHLSALAAEYKDRVTFLGIDIYEKNTTPMEKVKAFVDSMGVRMEYNVAAERVQLEDTNFILRRWRLGIPSCYVVNADGKIAWFGDPNRGLKEVLPQIVNNTWDIKSALATQNMTWRLEDFDDSLNYELMKFHGKMSTPNDFGNPDSALLIIDDVVRNEPGLKYARLMAYNTFFFLLMTNPHKAYEYGKLAMVTRSYPYEDPPFVEIVHCIESLSDKIYLPPEIYELGAAGYQMYVDYSPAVFDIPKNYHWMAAFYWNACEKSKAIEAEQKAVETLENEKNSSKTQLAKYESQLQQYKTMRM